MGKGALVGLILVAAIGVSQVAQARFLSVDPKGPKPGNTFSFNRYSYANNNPVVNIDPDGRYACGSTDKAVCSQFDGFVHTMNTALSHLNQKSATYTSLNAVSQHIGKAGDGNGVTLTGGSLKEGQIAVANSATLMTIDTKQASTLSAPFRQYNSGRSSESLAKAFGASAVAHEGQHQLDYLNPKIGYPTDRTTEMTTEMNAYRTELGVAKGLSLSTDLYAPGALPKNVNQRVQEAAAASTDAFCKANGC
jgi:hypothetical protein